MIKSDLIAELNTIKNAKRIYRDKSAEYVLDHPETFPFLLQEVFNLVSPLSIKAAWILELVCENNIQLLNPHLNYFIENLPIITNESAIRPLSKICNFIAIAYSKRQDISLLDQLTEYHKEKMIEISFDWLINDHKVAAKVYAMDTLFLFSKEFDWIRQELLLVLQQNYSKGSAGYKSHAKMIINEINKSTFI